MAQIRKIKHLLCATFLIYTLFPIHVYAEDATGLISMQGVNTSDQGYFILDGKPGAQASITVILQNVSEEFPAQSLLFTADAVVAAGGGMGTVPPDTALRDNVGSWFDLKEQDISLDPGESREITLQVEIPEDVSPGEHIGQVALYKFISGAPSEEQTNSNEAKVYVNKAYTQAIAVVVKIPGPQTHKMTLSSLKSEWVGTESFLSLTITNDGNMIEKLSKGNMKISQDGTVVHTQNGEINSIYPGTSGVWSFPLPKKLQVEGSYSADVEWSYGDQTISKSFEFTIESADVKNAEIINIASEKAAQGKSISTGSLVFSREMIYQSIGIIAIIVIALVLLVFFAMRRFYKRKSLKKPPFDVPVLTPLQSITPSQPVTPSLSVPPSQIAMRAQTAATAETAWTAQPALPPRSSKHTRS